MKFAVLVASASASFTQRAYVFAFHSASASGSSSPGSSLLKNTKASLRISKAKSSCSYECFMGGSLVKLSGLNNLFSVVKRTARHFSTHRHPLQHAVLAGVVLPITQVARGPVRSLWCAVAVGGLCFLHASIFFHLPDNW